MTTGEEGKTGRFDGIMKIVIGALIVLLFVVLASVAIGFGVLTLWEARAQAIPALAIPPTPPPPPTPPQLQIVDTGQPAQTQETQLSVLTKQVEAYTQYVNAYTQQVGAYTQQAAAYKTYAESTSNSQRIAAYNTVVKDTLQPILSTVLVTLLAFAFAKVGSQAIQNIVALRQGTPAKDLPPLKFF